MFFQDSDRCVGFWLGYGCRIFGLVHRFLDLGQSGVDVGT